MNGILSFYECRYSVGDATVWWGHSNRKLCKITCLNILHSLAMAMQKNWVRVFTAFLMPSLAPFLAPGNKESPGAVSTT